MNTPIDYTKAEIEFKKLPKATREFSSFMHLIIVETLETFPDELTPTYIRCFKKNCHGTISTMYDCDKDEVRWKCSDCIMGGNITNFLKEETV